MLIALQWLLLLVLVHEIKVVVFLNLLVHVVRLLLLIWKVLLILLLNALSKNFAKLLHHVHRVLLRRRFVVGV